MTRVLALALLLAACGGTTPRVCDWGPCRPSEDAVRVDHPDSEWWPTWLAVRESWAEGDLPEPSSTRVWLILRPLDGIAGYVATSSRNRSVLVIDPRYGDAVTRDTVVHELVHLLGLRAGIGSDVPHQDARRFLTPGRVAIERDHVSVESRAMWRVRQ